MSDCGCRIDLNFIDILQRQGLEFSIIYCPIHKAAPDLLELLKEWLKTPYFETFEEWENWVGDYGPRVEQALVQAKEKSK